MRIDPTGVPGVLVVSPDVHRDDRGLFLEWLSGDAVAEAVGHPVRVRQANASVSARGVLRGIHYADVPPGQAKYVTCLAGAVLDVAVDLRVGSPSFGTFTTVRLDDAERRAIYLPEGVGHAFVALADGSCVTYLCSEPYNPTAEHEVHPLDPAIGITWPTELTPQLSPKDAAAPTLAEALAAGALPDYAACQALAR